MKRNPKTIAFLAVLLLVCCIAASLWWRSENRFDLLRWQNARHDAFELISGSGIVSLAWGKYDVPSQPLVGWSGTFFPFKNKLPTISVWGDGRGNDGSLLSPADFHFGSFVINSPKARIATTAVRLPWWSITTAALALPLIFFGRGILVGVRRRQSTGSGPTHPCPAAA